MTIYSYSRLKCFEQCPRKYKFRYIDKIRTEVKESIGLFMGKRVHETLKKLYQDLRYQKMNTLEDLSFFLQNEWSKKWNDGIVVLGQKYDQEDYLKMAEQCITGYYSRYKPFAQGRTIALEKRILFDLDGTNKYRLCGYIDRVAKTNDGCYEIHDYKTCSRFPSLKYLQKDWQLALYAIGLRKRYPYVRNIKLIWHFLKFDREIDSTRTDEDLEELRHNTIQLIEIIEHTEEFFPNPSKLCDWCKFKPMCK